MSLALALVLTANSFTVTTTGGDLLLKVGELAPPFSMRDLDKSMYVLSDYVGVDAKDRRKAVLLAFFATWCEPCKKEIPIIKEIHQKWQKKGVSVVYVGLSQGAKDLEPFTREKQLEWPVVPDAFGLLGRRYGASQLPHLFIIDSEGRIAFQHRGIASDLRDMLDAQLARITGERGSLVASAPQDIVSERFTRKLLLGRIPSGAGSAARWQPLAVYVGELLNAEVEVSTEPSYDTFEAALRAGKYDIANAGPLVCHEVASMYEPAARLERQNVPTYQGLLFVPRASPVRTISDLRGKRLGLVSERSTSGGLYVKLALLQAGLRPGVDVGIVWLGSHERVAAAVKSGEVDAGGCYEDCRDSAWPDEHEKVAATRVIGYTPPIPGEMIIIRRGLDAKSKQTIRQALLSLNDSTGILAQISQGELTVTGFVPATERDLAAVEDAIAKVNATPAH